MISIQRGCWGRLWQRSQASCQQGPRRRELFTGSQMLEMKRTCKNTSHSSIPPCNVGPFPRAYGLFPSDFKGSIITNKYVPSTLCVLCVVPIVRGGDKWASPPLEQVAILREKSASHTCCLSPPGYLSLHPDTTYLSDTYHSCT